MELEPLVISADDLATLLEAAYFYNLLAVLGGLFVYDTLRSCVGYAVTEYKKKRSLPTD
ncbi:hypothetical protein QNE21_000397 [Vibrio vulnificus]|nr:hypothetical protein [Vibrio vulnificus]